MLFDGRLKQAIENLNDLRGVQIAIVVAAQAVFVKDLDRVADFNQIDFDKKI